MRHVLVAALLITLAPGLAAAQSASGAWTRARECESCAQDSSARAAQKRRPDRRARLERITTIAHELTTVRRALDDRRELSNAERRRLERRADELESQLVKLGATVGLDVTEHVLREMRPALAEARRAMAAAAAQASVAAAAALPGGRRFSGWIGIALDAPCEVEVRGSDVYWRFLEQPRIVSVDPGSPADRAGIRQGDVLLAYDGQDVRREIAMNRLLEPGRMIRVRVRARGEEVRDVPVRVASVRELAWRERVVLPPRAPKVKPPRPPTEWPMVAPAAREPMPAPDPRATLLPFSHGRGFNGLAGAHMETITPGLGETIGVERGVLVLSVAPGVPAHESGLLDGDVIVKADGRDVATLGELRAVLAGADGRAVKLDVTRRGKVRQVTLRW